MSETADNPLPFSQLSSKNSPEEGLFLNRTELACMLVTIIQVIRGIIILLNDLVVSDH